MLEALDMRFRDRFAAQFTKTTVAPFGEIAATTAMHFDFDQIHWQIPTPQSCTHHELRLDEDFGFHHETV